MSPQKNSLRKKVIIGAAALGLAYGAYTFGGLLRLHYLEIKKNIVRTEMIMKARTMPEYEQAIYLFFKTQEMQELYTKQEKTLKYNPLLKLFPEPKYEWHFHVEEKKPVRTYEV